VLFLSLSLSLPLEGHGGEEDPRWSEQISQNPNQLRWKYNTLLACLAFLESSVDYLWICTLRVVQLPNLVLYHSILYSTDLFPLRRKARARI
jgi:hypothetical protein